LDAALGPSVLHWWRQTLKEEITSNAASNGKSTVFETMWRRCALADWPVSRRGGLLHSAAYGGPWGP
jgi:hypothetical protein